MKDFPLQIRLSLIKILAGKLLIDLDQIGLDIQDGAEKGNEFDSLYVLAKLLDELYKERPLPF